MNELYCRGCGSKYLDIKKKNGILVKYICLKCDEVFIYEERYITIGYCSICDIAIKIKIYGYMRLSNNSWSSEPYMCGLINSFKLCNKCKKGFKKLFNRGI